MQYVLRPAAWQELLVTAHYIGVVMAKLVALRMLQVTIYLTCVQLVATAAEMTVTISAVAQCVEVLVTGETLMQPEAAEQLVAGATHTFGIKAHQADLRWVLKDPGTVAIIAAHAIQDHLEFFQVPAVLLYNLTFAAAAHRAQLEPTGWLEFTIKRTIMTQYAIYFRTDDGTVLTGNVFTGSEIPPDSVTPPGAQLVKFDHNTPKFNELYGVLVEDPNKQFSEYIPAHSGGVVYDFNDGTFEFFKVEATNFLADVRAMRNTLLAETDILAMVPDYPESIKSQLTAYRQALRDIIADLDPSWTHVRDVVWPTLPAAFSRTAPQLITVD